MVASACVHADDGVMTPDGFLDCAAMGFPLGSFGMVVPVDEAWADALAAHADRRGRIATVSTCSGMDALAKAIAERTGAVAEAMEGAAAAHAAFMLGLKAGEVRVISNTTGDRGAQVWDLKGALARLEALAATLARR